MKWHFPAEIYLFSILRRAVRDLHVEGMTMVIGGTTAHCGQWGNPMKITGFKIHAGVSQPRIFQAMYVLVDVDHQLKSQPPTLRLCFPFRGMSRSARLPDVGPLNNLVGCCSTETYDIIVHRSSPEAPQRHLRRQERNWHFHVVSSSVPPNARYSQDPRETLCRPCRCLASG
jgi:hypothetical protein